MGYDHFGTLLKTTKGYTETSRTGENWTCGQSLPEQFGRTEPDPIQQANQEYSATKPQYVTAKQRVSECFLTCKTSYDVNIGELSTTSGFLWLPFKATEETKQY